MYGSSREIEGISSKKRGIPIHLPWISLLTLLLGLYHATLLLLRLSGYSCHDLPSRLGYLSFIAPLFRLPHYNRLVSIPVS